MSKYRCLVYCGGARVSKKKGGTQGLSASRSNFREWESQTNHFRRRGGGEKDLNWFARDIDTNLKERKRSAGDKESHRTPFDKGVTNETQSGSKR